MDQKIKKRIDDSLQDLEDKESLVHSVDAEMVRVRNELGNLTEQLSAVKEDWREAESIVEVLMREHVPQILRGDRLYSLDEDEELEYSDASNFLNLNEQ